MASLKQLLDLATSLRSLVALEIITKAEADRKFRRESGINLFPPKKRKRHGRLRQGR